MHLPNPSGSTQERFVPCSHCAPVWVGRASQEWRGAILGGRTVTHTVIQRAVALKLLVPGTPHGVWCSLGTLLCRMLANE